MKSVKRGRAPSLMGGIAALAVGIVGILFTLNARGMGAPGIFSAFGIIFVLLAFGSGVYEIVNATRKNRFSEYDVTDDAEEPDPLNLMIQGKRFCPQCGARVGEQDRFCAACGNQLGESTEGIGSVR